MRTIKDIHSRAHSLTKIHMHIMDKTDAFGPRENYYYEIRSDIDKKISLKLMFIYGRDYYNGKLTEIFEAKFTVRI